MVKAALSANVGRFVFTSTGSTIGRPYPPTKEIVTVDETSEYNLGALRMVYPHTKWLAEKEVERGIEEGLDAVITHPTAVFGPGDWKGNSCRFSSRRGRRRAWPRQTGFGRRVT